MCLEAVITTQGVGTAQVINEGTTYAFDDFFGDCGGAKTLPSGWLAVTLDGYRNGSFCGTTYYQYSTTSTSAFGVATSLCSNPSGSQTFNTNVFGRVYNGSAYVNLPGIAGPAQNG
jgi:hypothetical protein